MKKWNKFHAASIALAGLCMAALINGAPASAADAIKPDNTKVNQRDRNAAEMTADQQGGSKQDREMTRQIRRAIVKDKSLSTYAHNIKIISRDGVVTLKGPVKSDAERRIILDKALPIAGGRITDEISVKR